MKKIALFIISWFTIIDFTYAQNVIIQNQNYQISQPVKVVEKIVTQPEYIYIDTTPKSPVPYVLHGFLNVFPEDLGAFDEYPKVLIDRINKSKSYGISTWRLPTEQEIKIMLQNAEKIKLNNVVTRVGGHWKGKQESNYMYWFITMAGDYVGAYNLIDAEFYTHSRGGTASRDKLIPTPRVIRLVSDVF